MSGRWTGIFDVIPFWFLLALMAWGAFRTWPYLSRYGADALRDAVIWGYGAFALIIFGYILARPSRLAILLRWYQRFSQLFPVIVLVFWLVHLFFKEAMPLCPWADVPLIDTKSGDSLAHLAGILAFWVAGLGGGVGGFQLLSLASCAVVLGTFSRGGLLSFLAAFGLCFSLRPPHRLLWRLMGVGVCGLVILAATGVQFELPGRDRPISAGQIATNMLSLVSESDTGDLDGTKQWRLAWWEEIIKYTIKGRYFWTGKGFGINLADDDGFRLDSEGSLRSPHNGHLTILARAGVPGFVLWGLVQLSWGCEIFGGYLRSHWTGDRRWSGLFLFLLTYWVAFMINAAFDVFLEGPMGGVWFWTIYGIGLSAMWLYRHRPEVLRPDEAPIRVQPAAVCAGR